jgi:cAMP-dependent protein kinase regulator
VCATVHDCHCCREGEEGDNFYVIESGDFVAVKGGQQVFKYEGSGSFGELALMYNCPRAATVQVGG